MRLEGRVKMGYYATPLSVVDRIRTYLHFPDENVNILDPCCGEGLALKTLAYSSNATTYGIELDAHRADQAKENLDHVLKGSYEDARISNSAFSCLFLNPPYDWEIPSDSENASGERMEKTFLQRTIKYLQPHGVLIYIIPQKRLSKDIAKNLSYRFEEFSVYQFPEEEYKDFGQIVLFGTRKAQNALDEMTFKKLEAVPHQILDKIPYCSHPRYELLPSEKVSLFRSSVIDEQELGKELENSPLWKRFRDQARIDDTSLGRPPLPLHTGHLGLLLANGCLDGIIGEGDDRHIVRGKVEKITNRYTEYEGTTLIEREVDSYRVSVRILKKDGEMKTLM